MASNQPAPPPGFEELGATPPPGFEDIPQTTGALRDLGLIGSNVAKGVASAAGMPGDVQNWVNQHVGQPVQSALGITNPLPNTFLPTSQQTVGFAARNGIVDRPDLQPRGAVENSIAAASQGAGESLPFLPLGGPGAVIAGAGSGLGSYWGAKVTPEHPLLGSTVGGLVGGGILGPLSTVANRGVNLLRGNLSDVGEAYGTAGITPRLTGDVSGNPALEQIQAFASRTPGGISRTQRAMQATLNDFGNSVEQTAGTLGASRTAQDAGTALQNSARDWVNNVFPARQQAAWAPVDSAMGNAPVPLTNYRQTLANVQAQLGRLQQSGQTLGGNETQRLLDAINSDLPRGVPQLGIPDSPATWQEAQSLRRAVGDALGTPEISQRLGQQRLTQLYGALSQDMGNAATAVNPAAATAFRNANAVSTNGFAFRNNVLGRVISANNPAQESITPERAAQTVLNTGNTGGTTLQAIRQEMPQAADDLAAFKLRDMALSNPGQQGAAGNAVSPNTFLTDWNRLSPQGQQALYADPAVRQRVDALATVSEGIRETARRVNTSNTAPGLISWEALNSAITRAAGGAMGTHEVLGFTGPLGAAAGAAVGGIGPLLPGAIASRIGASRPLASLLAAQRMGFPGQGAVIGAGVGAGNALLGRPQPLPILGAPPQQ